ncbi:hypothetical protein DP42_5505 [Burkholderia pseudomallei]|nr:hypothetical protein DO73_5087 [Burkholderia pseudomallei]KGD25286.1 hypothetical protein DP42_5505 [Burkholderia pseudomallei]KGY01879.1 hypothetical protein X997_3139 [Burkholderia pseudomallei A79C]
MAALCGCTSAKRTTNRAINISFEIYLACYRKAARENFGRLIHCLDRCLILHRIARNIRLSGFN